MPKFFVMSDIHGFYDEMKKVLDEAGFDPNDENHWFIGCGDYMDRGEKPGEVISFLNRLPRKILVKGNHEQLILDCIYNGYPQYHDISNGTAKTIIDLAGQNEEFDIACTQVYPRVKHFVGKMVNYFETKNYIFVHGWIPLEDMSYSPNWRESHQVDWDEATWHNGIEMAMRGFIEPNKTIVCGHFHTSWGHHRKDKSPEWGDGANFEPYYDDGIIAIDACTAYSGKCNVIVLEDEFLEGQYAR